MGRWVTGLQFSLARERSERNTERKTEENIKSFVHLFV